MPVRAHQQRRDRTCVTSKKLRRALLALHGALVRLCRASVRCALLVSVQRGELLRVPPLQSPAEVRSCARPLCSKVLPPLARATLSSSLCCDGPIPTLRRDVSSPVCAFWSRASLCQAARCGPPQSSLLKSARYDNGRPGGPLPSERASNRQQLHSTATVRCSIFASERPALVLSLLLTAMHTYT